MLDYFALGVLIFAAIVLFYGIIAIHDIPYEIAVHRKHPHQDAIHVAGWVSLFTLHVIWPFLWIWATLYREDRGWGFSTAPKDDSARLQLIEQQVAELKARLDALERQTSTETLAARD
ncbi:DUF3302 domain-containing protein [Ectopseudomonas guguanensis]|uniref:DUF3302 domain-containing protein n=1 Tax=Ectopseudomonas guguanensis TaxID=1198456 RepID=UPI0028B139E9|nr:DUF3302 domain-containing protein [Pseudomonas guguanensis]